MGTDPLPLSCSRSGVGLYLHIPTIIFLLMISVSKPFLFACVSIKAPRLSKYTIQTNSIPCILSFAYHDEKRLLSSIDRCIYLHFLIANAFPVYVDKFSW